MIYLDNAATTALSPTALKKMMEVAEETYGNPSSIHQAGRKANHILRQARQAIAQVLKVSPERIFFTSGGSEADNLAIQGYALSHQTQGKHLITTAIEHHAVLHTMQYLEERFGFEVTYLEPVDQVITAQQVKKALRPDTILVSIMFANNETGQLLPIREIGGLLADHPAVFHVDAVQALGKVSLEPDHYGIDLLSGSAHKFHGPKGIGFLYSRIPTFDALIHGGKQEGQRRAGTENLPAIAAMATALTEQVQELTKHTAHIQILHDQLLAGLEGIDHYLNQAGSHLPHVLNIGFPGQLNERLLMQLDMAGIAVSSGSACTAGVVQNSHVLEAMYGKQSHRLKESIRISLSDTNSLEDIDILIHQLHHLIGG